MKRTLEVALRIALMVPINNTTMEPELLAWLPKGTRCKTLKIPRGKSTLTSEDIPAYMEQAKALAATLVGEDLDLVVYGCTAASFLAGPARDAEIAKALSEVTGRPTVTTASSMVASLQSLGTRNIALVTPYSDLVNEKLQALLNQSGIRVNRLSSFRAASVDELAAIDSAAVAARARETMHDDCDAMFIACSQLPTYAIIGTLEEEFQRPVWSSIRATAWQVGQKLGLSFSAGRYFKKRG
jgi:maleate cis-trans isomerase